MMITTPEIPLVRNLTMLDFQRIYDMAREIGLYPKKWLFPEVLVLKHEIPSKILWIPCEVAPLLWGEKYTFAFLQVDVVLECDGMFGVVSFQGKEGAVMKFADNARLFTNYRLPGDQETNAYDSDNHDDANAKGG